MFYVMRPPCFQEDEGRTEFYGHFPSKELAEKKIIELTKDGYFTKHNFRIVTG